ncbi:MAG TPA: excinuclease ABC subunit UvrA [Candidatus Pacearchaeota archaeon]|nr:excinuclease ABC subunit UvrA [Candidatus Pacearchaeota archaeon]HRR94761.1 excinuclease ABC subunit UvrA [Candidatus Paceibacterota bacterium]HPC30540.1 excinuclease ABC subunit UvrA [Candidatus Pacearchaeota archaeon]HQG09211.1 excinuclease ABC subunit UvrA [Candidatus Pacearchaeota archaeon]HQH20138.1 excinuclease ABC subunit UvrA [Candidatus Pacearchaeota archaeon]
MQNKIIIKGAREHNLKNIFLELPRNKMVVFTGVSGSGKSSLAFDTIFAEGQRRYIESLSSYARQFLGGMQKPDVDEIEGLSPAISISQKAHSANPRSTVATLTEIYDYLRVLFARIGHPHCPQCGTAINKFTTDEIFKRIEGILKEKDKTGQLLILSPVVRGRKGEYYQLLQDTYEAGFAEVRIDGKLKNLKERVFLEKNQRHTIEIVIDKIFFNSIDDDFEFRLNEALEIAIDMANGLCSVIFPDGQEQIWSTEYSCPQCGFSFPEIEPRLFSFNSPYGFCEECHGLGTENIFSTTPCPACEGKRLNKNALSVTIDEKNIWEVTTLTIEQAFLFFKELEKKLSSKEREIAEIVLNEIKNRLQFMLDVGLNYIGLNRQAGTLSGGESQRIRLASQVGTKLVGALYVLDEPTIGLHQKDNERLIRTLRNLCDIGNSIIIVEHDEDTILKSDWVVDFGPKAGVQGGEIVFSGPLNNLLLKENNKTMYDCNVLGSAKSSLTGQYLRREKIIEKPAHRRGIQDNTLKLKVQKAYEHNLKNLSVEIPLGRFVCLTGVSGSGKSTLMNDIIYRYVSGKINHIKRDIKVEEIKNIEYIDRIIKIDQSPIGRTPRSNPATYTKVFDEIREIFAMTPEARLRGYKAGRFSFNKPGGRCERCEGRGILEIEMHFLPSVEILCDVCKGKRFNKETLFINYKGKNISQVLDMTIEEGVEFFHDIPSIYDKLKFLNEVGLGYLTLGQPATTLSGGESQRIKLSRELSKHSLTRTLYLLDEPTTGLHYDDIKKLIVLLQELVAHGNTVLVIEHNLDFIKCADWIIDLGPEGGDRGGQLMAEGTPEEVAKKPCATGKYLRKVLEI